MSNAHTNNYPKLHNAAWPGVVGKGDGGEPPIDWTHARSTGRGAGRGERSWLR